MNSQDNHFSPTSRVLNKFRGLAILRQLLLQAKHLELLPTNFFNFLDRGKSEIPCSIVPKFQFHGYGIRTLSPESRAFACAIELSEAQALQLSKTGGKNWTVWVT